MEKDFNLDSIGKRMPYTVPDNFFSDMEQTVMERVADTRSVTLKSTHKVRLMRRMAIAAAAVAVLVLTFSHWQPSVATAEAETLEQAFDRLDAADQAYLMEAYSDDIFINEQLNQ